MKQTIGAAMMSVFSLFACADAPSDSSFQLETLASGIPHAINTGAGTWQDSSRPVAQVGLTVGRIEGEGPDVFGSVRDVEVDDAGRLYVLDGQAQDVRVFDSDGTHVRTLGGPGEGPGELRGAGGLNVDAEGNLWVWDPGNARFTAFSPDGGLLGSVPRRVAAVSFPWRGEIDRASGDMIDLGLERPDMKSSLDMGRLTVYYPIRVDLSSGDLDTLPSFRYEMSSDHEFRVPFRRSLTFAFTRSGDIWLAHTDEYRLHRITLEGDTTLVVSRLGVAPMPVTAAERDSVLVRPDPFGDLTGEPLRPDWIPTHKPVLVGMTSDGAGHLFVFPRLADREPGTVVDVFRSDNGEFLGQIELPVRLDLNPPPVARPGFLVGVTRGEFDVDVVVRIDLVHSTIGG